MGTIGFHTPPFMFLTMQRFSYIYIELYFRKKVIFVVKNNKI